MNRLHSISAQLQARLKPGPDDAKALAVILAKLMAAFPTQAQSETATDQRVDAYFEALGGVPAWAVDKAAKAVLRGETEADGRFMPTPPQLAELAHGFVSPVAADLATVQRIMAARPLGAEPDAAERERVKEGFASLLAELRGEDDQEPANADFLRRCAEMGVDPDSIRDAPPRKDGLQPMKGIAT